MYINKRLTSSLSLTVGTPISISLSNRPGRRRAGSSDSGRTVAARTITNLSGLDFYNVIYQRVM